MIVGWLLFLSGCNNTSRQKSESVKAQRLPNIVLILSDDQAWTDYGFMGHDHIATPNIDQLAKEGLTFERGYVPTSLCSPSLASIITGLYPRNHGILGNDRVPVGQLKTDDRSVRAQRFQPVIQNFRTLKKLPELLHQKGYLSFQTGKWWLGNSSEGGFDYGMTHGDPAKGGRHGDVGLEIGRNGMDPVNNYIDLALEKDQPFFMWYAPFLPHTPHNPPDSLLDKYLPIAPSELVAKYWAMCEWFDITIGQLHNYIDEKGLMENTLFIYVCDNGWVQDYNEPTFTKNSKRSPYDFGMRTPIILKWKGKIKPFINSETLVSSIDIAPTILDLVGINKPSNMHGSNMLNPEQLHARKAIFGEIYAHDFNSIDSSLFYRIAISKPYKLIWPDANNKPDEEIELYNVYEDPFEKVNLAKSKQEVVADLKSKIEVQWKKN